MGDETAPVKRGRGRPTDYKKSYVKRAEKLALLGLTEEQMAAAFDVTRPTLRAWKKAHPEFLSAITRAKDEADADVAVALRQRAIGYSHPETVINSYQGTIIKTRVVRQYPPDTQAAAIWLYNRQPALWRRIPSDQGGDEPTPVKVVVEVKDGRTKPDDADAQPSAG